MRALLPTLLCAGMLRLSAAACPLGEGPLCAALQAEPEDVALNMLQMRGHGSRAESDVAAESGEETQLELVLAVSRHGIESMIQDYKKLGLTDKEIDQDYGAPDSHATPHSLEFAKLLGAKYREQYGEALKLTNASCEALNEAVKIYADNDERDESSGYQWLAGFAPGCNLSALSGEHTHVLLHEGKESMLSDGCTYASQEEVEGLIGGNIDTWARANYGEQMDALGEIFGCCSPELCGKKEGETCKLRDVPNKWVGGYWDTWTGGMQYAAWMGATLQTQLSNNNTVLGNLSSAKIAWLYKVTEAFWWTYRNPINAHRFGSTLSAYLAATLLSVSTGQPVIGPEQMLGGASKARFQWFMAHGVNVGLLLEMLQLHTQTPDYGKDTASICLGPIIFELHSKGQHPKVSTVRVFSEAPKPTGMRTLNASDVFRSPVSISGCSRPLDCPLGEFVHLVLISVDPECMPEALREFATPGVPAYRRGASLPKAFAPGVPAYRPVAPI